MDKKIKDRYRNLFSLEGKIAIVTGAYGHLGSAISQALAGFNATVILLGKNEQKLKTLIRQHPEFKGKSEYYISDVTDEKKFQTIVKDIITKHSNVDILVNNAYEKQNEPFEELTKEAWDHAIATSLTHYVTCAQTVSGAMLKQKSGSIINIASIYAFLGVDQRIFLDLGNNPPIHYTVAKGGILQITKYLATLWADKGIRVNAISPGYFPKKRPGVPERLDYIHEITQRTPMRRIGQPDEITGAVVYLASNASSFVTGQNIIVDGGWSSW
ncbi:MAG TPA: SDR family oxidoreductase [Candidatus Thermoplasmatota archaeon]|nr:SDR family oxidoreductase [Candidatus Thermoplasmatota archaeon]